MNKIVQTSKHSEHLLSEEWITELMSE
jgi:hypothetical protein